MTASSEHARLRRYSRHLLVPDIGLAGQERLAAARVLCIGIGGLGTPAIAYLAAAGVGCIGLMDDDQVDLTNLQRQILYAQADIGRWKVDIAQERLQALNPHVRVEAFRSRLTPENACALMQSYDLVIDGTDSFPTRYLINDAAILMGRANVFASIYRFEAQITCFAPHGRPCYRCLYPTPPPPELRPSCAEGGVLGAVAGVAGSWQAIEAMKLLMGVGTSLAGRILRVDALHAKQRELQLAPDPDCMLCGEQATITSIDPQRYIQPEPVPLGDLEIEAEQVDRYLRHGALLLDLREAHELALGPIEGALHIPYTQLEARLSELDTRREYVVACRVGARSLHAMRRLQDAGLERLRHLRGGLLAYGILHADLDVF